MKFILLCIILSTTLTRKLKAKSKQLENIQEFYFRKENTPYSKMRHYLLNYRYNNGFYFYLGKKKLPLETINFDEIQVETYNIAKPNEQKYEASSSTEGVLYLINDVMNTDEIQNGIQMHEGHIAPWYGLCLYISNDKKVPFNNLIYQMLFYYENKIIIPFLNIKNFEKIRKPGAMKDRIQITLSSFWNKNIEAKIFFLISIGQGGETLGRIPSQYMEIINSLKPVCEEYLKVKAHIFWKYSADFKKCAIETIGKPKINKSSCEETKIRLFSDAFLAISSLRGDMPTNDYRLPFFSYVDFNDSKKIPNEKEKSYIREALYNLKQKEIETNSKMIVYGEKNFNIDLN